MDKIEIKKNSDIDKVLWDKLVNKHRSPYLLSWYLDIVSPNWKLITNEDLDCFFPLTVKNKFLFSYLVNPKFIQRLQFVGNCNEENKECLLKYLLDKYWYLNINLELKTELISNKIRKSNTFINFKNHKFKLSQNHKRNLRIYNSSGCTLELKSEENFISELIEFYKKNNPYNLKESEFHLLNSIFHKSLKNGNGFFITSKHEGLLNAFGFFIHTDRVVTFITSASNKMGRDLRSMFGILNHALEYSSDRFDFFDFEGSNDKNLNRFYKGFGGEIESYYNYKVFISLKNLLKR